jgi:hypothetical protein
METSEPGSGAPQQPATSGSRKELVASQVANKLSASLAEVNSNKLKRAVWRAGELRLAQCLDDLLSLPGKNCDEMLQYCVAWSLGRMAKPLQEAAAQEELKKAAEAVASLNSNATSLMVRRISYEALLQLAPDEEKKNLLQPVYSSLPGAFFSLLESAEVGNLEAHVSQLFDKLTPETPKLLYNLYLTSLTYPLLHKALLQEIPNLKLKPNVFKGVRYIFKTAEFRGDMAMYGTCSLAMERCRPYLNVPSYYYDDGEVMIPGQWKFVKLKNEVVKPNSRVAYTDLTRHYMKRRAWRSLRKLGIAESEDYVPMATGVLLAFKDVHGDQGESFHRYQWVADPDDEWNGRYETLHYHYSPYSSYLALNKILFSHSERFELSAGSRRWMFKPGTDTDSEAETREEAFPELWDRQPQYLIQLLCESECAPVQTFAVNAIADKADLLQDISKTQLKQILQKPYAKTVAIGLAIARALYARSGIDTELVDCLIQSPVEAARALAIEWINANVSVLEQNPQIFNSTLTSQYADIRKQAVEWLGKITVDEAGAAAIVARIFAFLNGGRDFDQELLDDLKAVLTGPLKQVTAKVDISTIQDLLNHSQNSVKGLAGELLIQHETPAEQLPAAIFKVLIENSNPEVRAIGIRLYGSLPDSILLNQSDIILSYILSESSEVRRAARPIMGRLTTNNAEFARKAVDELIPLLFRSEPFDGFHRDLLVLLKEDLAGLADQFDKDMTWRLLVARSNAANEYGAFLLQRLEPTQYTVRQWAHLSKNPVRAVREWSWSSYEKYLDTVKKNPIDALRILDNRWDDSREFAIRFFATRFTANEWTPELMVSVCDSTRDDVQTLGRDLITRFFDEGHGIEYLTKLSQHPSVNVQLFTTNYLSRYAVDDHERLGQLKHYFVTVLSHVNKARVAKLRIVDFLHQEAMKSQEAAQIAADIFARQSVSIVLRDKANFITAMRDICNQYPSIEMPIKKRAVEVRQARGGVNQNAV